jgi:hypothetical protein
MTTRAENPLEGGDVAIPGRCKHGLKNTYLPG